MACIGPCSTGCCRYYISSPTVLSEWECAGAVLRWDEIDRIQMGVGAKFTYHCVTHPKEGCQAGV